MKKVILKAVLVLGVFSMMQGCANVNSNRFSYKDRGYKTLEEMQKSGEKNFYCEVDYSGISWCKKNK